MDRRVELHARVVRLLAHRSPRDHNLLVTLADHAARAVPHVPGGDAARLCIDAAESSFRRLAFEEADRLYELGVAHVHPDDERRRSASWAG
jgi:hypothetical protein